MARIRNPKILLMAPTALGPNRRTNGPPNQKKSNTVSAIPAMPITMPMYEAALSTLAASAMTTPMAPGPDISGIASGVREMSSLSCASLLSSGVMRAWEVTMPQAVLATISPPAIFKTGSEMPKKCSTKRPKNRNVTRMTNTQRPVFSAVLRRSCGVQDDVMLKKMGIPPKGSTMGNNARNVAAAECGSVRRNCPRAWVVVMGSGGFERIEDRYPEMPEIFFVPGRHGKPVQAGGRRNHDVVQEVFLPAHHHPCHLAETTRVHRQYNRRVLQIVNPSLNGAGFRCILFTGALDALLQFSKRNRRKTDLLVPQAVKPFHHSSVRLRFTNLRNYVRVEQIPGHSNSTDGRRPHLPRGRTMFSKRGPDRSNSLIPGRDALCIRRHSSMGTSTAASTPRRVTTCGPFLSAASRNSLKRAFASCNCQELTGSFLQRHCMTSHMTSQAEHTTDILPAPWPRARALPLERPTADAPARHPPCRELHSLPGSLPRHIPYIRPERKSHGETRDGAAAPQAPAKRAQRPAASDSTVPDLAADSSASPKSSPPHFENVLLPRSLHSDRAHARRIYSQPFSWPHRDRRQSLFRILRSRRAERRHRPCAMPPGRRLAPSPARKRNPD